MSIFFCILQMGASHLPVWMPWQNYRLRHQKGSHCSYKIWMLWLNKKSCKKRLDLDFTWNFNQTFCSSKQNKCKISKKQFFLIKLAYSDINDYIFFVFVLYLYTCSINCSKSRPLYKLTDQTQHCCYLIIYCYHRHMYTSALDCVRSTDWQFVVRYTCSSKKSFC